MNIPNHVAIIVDGNGRWAKERGLPRSLGHYEGSKTLESLASYIFDKGIKVLSIFAFSVENFKRDDEEVNYLMELFYASFKSLAKKLKEKNVKVVFSKKESGLPEKLEKLIKKISEESVNNTRGILNICINYGSQDEIVDMTKKIALKIKNNEINIKNITKEIINANLYAHLPAVDLLIRTSGECRLSNFMLFQLYYAELYFTNTYFPDFNSKEFDKALMEYNKRNRRFGDVKK